MRNVKTREGFEYWDKICSLKHYGFLHSPDGKRVVKTEGIGNWIDKFEAQEIVDQAQEEINQYRAERDALQQRLTAADERADVLEGLLRLARGAIGENQWTLLTKDIDAMVSRDAQRTNNSGKAHCPHDGICHTSEETCAEARARIASLTAPAGAGQ